MKNADKLYEKKLQRLRTHEELTNDVLRQLGDRQEEAVREILERMAAFLRRHEKQVSGDDKLLVDGLEPTSGRIFTGARLGQEPLSWMRGIAGSAVVGVGINTGITTAVTSLASASTGTAISTLSGAAATNATMAALGGGSLAAGGGGIAAGAAALNVVTIGPAMLVSGFMVAGQGEKARTGAREHEAEVNVAVAEMKMTRSKFDAVISRSRELGTLLDGLVARATSALDLLESEPFDPDCHAARFRTALTLVLAVRDVASTRVVDDAGDLDEASASPRIRYRNLITEAEND